MFAKLQVLDRLFQLFAGGVVGQWGKAFCGKAEVQQHQDLLIFRQVKGFGDSGRVKKVQPAAVHARVRRGQHHVGGDDGRILHTGIDFLTRVDKHAVFVKGNHQNRGRTVAAGSQLVNLSQPFRGLHNVNTLALQVFSSRRKAARLQNSVQLFCRNLLSIVLFARITIFYNLGKFHDKSSYNIFVGSLTASSRVAIQLVA